MANVEDTVLRVFSSLEFFRHGFGRQLTSGPIARLKSIFRKTPGIDRSQMEFARFIESIAWWELGVQLGYLDQYIAVEKEDIAEITNEILRSPQFVSWPAQFQDLASRLRDPDKGR
jgi:hypothetical protein